MASVRKGRRVGGEGMAELDDGDTVIVTRLDRQARSTRDLLNMLAAIGTANATFRSLHDVRADTTTPHGRLVLTVLGGLAEFERRLIAARTSGGPKRARANGVLFQAGAAPSARGAEARDRGRAAREIALSYAVDHSTVSRLKARDAAEV
jgi:DNA invertase Pin-like site-specific DNA recombinase